MPTEVFMNNGQTSVGSAYTAGATSLVVADASKLPSIGVGEQFRIVVFTPADPTNAEIMICTAVSGNTLTVTPAAESIGGIQTSFNHPVGDVVANELTVASLANYINQLAAVEGVNSFNTRTGAVTLTEADVETAVGINFGTAAGAATTDFAPMVHIHDDRYYTDVEVDTLLGNYSLTSHTHDDRYYTEFEILTLLGGYSPTGHTHDDRYYTETEVDTLLSSKSDTGHTHDDRYYTESEVNSLLSGKSDTGHTHDDRYYTEGEVDTLLGGYSTTSHNHDDRYYLDSEVDTLLGNYLTTATAASTYQPLDGDLTAIAALSGTNTIYYRSGANTWTAVTIGAGISFSGGVLSVTGDTLVNSWKKSVKAATAAPWPLANSFENGDFLDGITLATGDRILIKDQTSATENGIYTVNASGAPTRATDMDAGSEFPGAIVYVEQGGTNAGTTWVCTNATAPTLGATNITWANYNTKLGVLLPGNNLSDVADLPTARVTLGISPLQDAMKPIVLEDQKSSGTNAGTFTSGAWQTRTLNTEVSDSGGFCSLSSNQFTLTAGTYEVKARAPAYKVNGHQIRIRNTTAGTTLVLGGNAYSIGSIAGDGILDYAELAGVFTVAASQVLELQHYCQTTQATIGFGFANSFGTEVYAQVFLRKIA